MSKINMEYNLKISIDNSMAKKFANEIKDFINNKIGESGSLGEIQDEVCDNLEMDDDMGFSDIGVKLEVKWTHDYI